jgi:hypothetical protein
MKASTAPSLSSIAIPLERRPQHLLAELGCARHFQINRLQQRQGAYDLGGVESKLRCDQAARGVADYVRPLDFQLLQQGLTLPCLFSQACVAHARTARTAVADPVVMHDAKSTGPGERSDERCEEVRDHTGVHQDDRFPDALDCVLKIDPAQVGQLHGTR